MSELPRRRSARSRALIAGVALLLAIGFAALGVWQLERREWKHALIAAVDARAFAPPVAAPGPAEWAGLNAQDDAYRRVTVSGRWRHDRETLVQAVTDRGGGFWVLTPLETPRFTVLINRGFAPPDRREPGRRQEANSMPTATITGLLRMSEPDGGFLRGNAPAQDRWYSRDVAAIARAKGLTRAAPYFIDADGTPNPGDYPLGGLTVLRFTDNHMVYALTWFALMALCLFAAWRVRRPEAAS